MDEEIRKIVTDKISEVVGVLVESITQSVLEILEEEESGKKSQTIIFTPKKKVINNEKLSDDDKTFLKMVKAGIDKAKTQGKYYNISTGRAILKSPANSKNPEFIWYDKLRMVGKDSDEERLPKALRVLGYNQFNGEPNEEDNGESDEEKTAIKTCMIRPKPKNGTVKRATSSQPPKIRQTKVTRRKIKDQDDTEFIGCRINGTFYILKSLKDDSTGAIRHVIYAMFDEKLKRVIPLEDKNIAELKSKKMVCRTDLGLPVYDNEEDDESDVEIEENDMGDGTGFRIGLVINRLAAVNEESTTNPEENPRSFLDNEPDANTEFKVGKKEEEEEDTVDKASESIRNMREYSP